MIDVKHLSKRFNETLAVNDITFSVEPGELFALLGPNGAGKSTTIKMLTTLLKPTSGELSLDGHDVLKEPHLARKSFGIVFQDPSLDIDLSAFENMQLHAVMYGLTLKQSVKNSEELLKLVGLWERKDSLVKTFSGGMKRRLEIARGLLHHPRVLFLDEPTLGLDTQTRNLLWQYVDKMAKEKAMTILFTTHYLEEAENNATRIAVIDHGELLKIGSLKEILKDTDSKNLEQAYLKLTGKAIRDEEVSPHETWRAIRRARSMR